MGLLPVQGDRESNRCRRAYCSLISSKWLLFLVVCSAQAQTASDLFQQGRYAEAAAQLATGLEGLETQGVQGRSVAAILNALALAESKTGRYTEAEAHFKRAIVI